MKETLKLLNRLVKVFDVTDFYVINVTDFSEIRFQGRYTNDKLRIYLKLIKKFNVNENGYLYGERIVSGITVRFLFT